MTTLDSRGLLIACPHCGKRNRLSYEHLGQTGRCGSCQQDLPQVTEPAEADGVANFDALISHSVLPVLVDFWADWCPPCKMLAPELVKVAAAGAGRWIIAKVDTEKVRELAQRYRISSLPTMAVFRAGREIARQSGAMPAPAVQKFLESAIR